MSVDDDPAVVARRFAHALEHLRRTWDLQYVGAGPMPRAAGAASSRDEESALGDAATGDAMTGDAATGDAATGDAATGDAATGDAATAGASRDELGALGADTSDARSEVEPSRELESPSAVVPERPGAVSPEHPRSSTPEHPRSSTPEHPRSSTPEHPSSSVLASASSPGRAGPSAASSPRPPGTEPVPIADPAQRAEAAQARKEALREQAQQWSAGTKLEYLRRHNVGDCRRCPLARTRNEIVFGVGNAEADVMFVGEAPGADEDRQGEPFVGRAGQLLNRWLEQLGMRREDVYIANVLKCRPPGNRDPRPEEVDRCSPFLQAQIRAIEPRVIVALGRHAGMLLSRRDDMTLRAMRSTSRLQYDAGAPKGAPHARIRIPLVVTYHPAYVLRQEGGGRSPAPGRASPTEMVMTDLQRALSIARAG